MSTLLAIFLLSAAPTVELRTLDGRNLTGELTACDAAGVRVETVDGAVDTPAAEIWEITPSGELSAPRANPDAVTVELTDGSRIVADKYAVADGEATLQLSESVSLVVPTSGVANVRFAVSPELEQQWQDVLTKEVAGDLVVIKKDGALDYLEGVLGNTDADGGFAFTLDGETLPVKRSRLAGIVYFQKAADPLSAPIAIVTDTGGSRFAALELSLGEGALSGKSPAGANFSVPLEQLAKIDFSQGRVAYLSDMQWLRYEWTPYLGAGKLPKVLTDYYTPRLDRALEAPGLLVDGQRFTKGLSLHSRSELAYRLDGQYRRLQTLAGIDDRTEGLGAVRVVIRGDDRVLWEGEIAAGRPPEMLNLATDNVRILSILVDYGPDQDTGDHLDLCDAKVIR